jgi:hypothetical protein
MALYLAREERRARTSDRTLAAVAFGTILFKCLMNGYDFIIPALSMPAIPVIYYGIRVGWSRPRFVRRLLVLGIAMTAAVVISILILAVQLQASEGSLGAGLASIFSTLSRRTYADPTLYPSYAESLRANPWSVLWTYISEDLAIAPLSISFLDLIVVYAALTGLYLLVERIRRLDTADRGKARALIAATWISFVSAVSWFLVFKGQAYVHTHTNYLAWHMPFTLFGYAMCAFIVRSLIAAAVRRTHPSP